MDLESLGWNNYFEDNFSGYINKGFIAARVVSQQKNKYLLHCKNGIVAATIAGKSLL